MIQKVKQLKHIASWALGHANTFFSCYIAFVFVCGVLTLLVFISFLGPLSFHFFTAFVALSFGGFLCSIALAMLIVLTCDRFIRIANKKSKKQQAILGPTGVLTLVLAFALLVGGYGGIKSGVGIIKKDILHIHDRNDNKQQD